MNVRAVIFVLLSSISLSSCGQTKHGIRKIYAFRSEHLPGMARVDNEGRVINPRPDIVYTIYIEATSGDLTWSRAWKDGQSYNVVPIQLEGEQEVGVAKSTNEKILLRPAKGNKLWQLQLQRSDEPAAAPVEAKNGEIILQGKKGKKTFIQKVSPVVELEAIPSV